MTRVHYSTEQDWTKLQRLLNYLAGTQDIPLTLEIDDGPIEIVANIDSSHASHGMATIEDIQEYSLHWEKGQFKQYQQNNQLILSQAQNQNWWQPVTAQLQQSTY